MDSFPGAPTLSKRITGGTTDAAQQHGRFVRRLYGHHPLRRAVIAVVVVILLLPIGWSYSRALTAPGNTALSVRSVEWLRDHHLRWMVNDIENFWYTHHKPKKGGAPSGGLAAAIQSAAATTTTVAGTPTTAPGPLALPPPRAIPSIVAAPLPGEGEWSPLGQMVGGRTAMYAAYVRPDAVYTSLVTGVAWIDPNLARFELFAGVQEPGVGGWRYQAPMQATDRLALLAAFNSGFKLKDSEGGYYAESRMVRPLRSGGATLAITSDGIPTVGQWGRDVTMAPDLAFARQNLSLIVDGGQPVAGLDTDSLSRWGATLGNKVQVWRSGVGVTANGAIVYAAGNNLSISMLAGVLARAGAIRAMELDINSAWVEFVTYGPEPPSPTVADAKLLPDMSGSTGKYLGANSRDFVAIFRRA